MGRGASAAKFLEEGRLIRNLRPSRAYHMPLEDGASIAVIGGGPTGSFFSIFALKMARMMDKELKVTIFEPKDFAQAGPGGCNRCGGIISELLVQTLAVEGIVLTDNVVRKGINSYVLHTNEGSVSMETPHHEKTIATVYRGGGPRGMSMGGKESFDHYLLEQAVKEGATRSTLRIERLESGNGKPVLFSRKEKVMEADLVVGAFGVNSSTARIFEEMGFGYRQPETVTAAIAEIKMGEAVVAEHFGAAIHLFLLPDKGIKFAAVIPKGDYVSLCILGDKMHANTIDDFMSKPVVGAVMPKAAPFSIECRCLPKMNIRAPRVPFMDRVVMCGDAGSTRLFKDGLGAAYLMGKSAAKTALFQGIGKSDFKKEYLTVYRSIINDNYFGRYLYLITDMYRKSGVLTRGMIETVRKEQFRPGPDKPLSSVLWDMFTGNERYRNIIPHALSLSMHLDLAGEHVKAASGKIRQARDVMMKRIYERENQ